MPHGTTFMQAAHAAELALARMSLLSLLAREVEANPAAVELRVGVTAEDGLQTVEFQALDASGRVLGGYSV